MLKKRSNGSAPGPNGIPYLVYKRIFFCARVIHTILSRIMVSGITPKCFGIAYISLIPKDLDNLHDVSKFRPIACLNVEGKMLWSILASRLISFCRKNHFLPGIIQKGFLPGLSGCLEHTSVLMAALCDAKRKNRTIIITCIDSASAYGDVRHNLMYFSLPWFHVPAWVCNLIKSYYN